MHGRPVAPRCRLLDMRQAQAIDAPQARRWSEWANQACAGEDASEFGPKWTDRDLSK
jgi:hypothetical protein